MSSFAGMKFTYEERNRCVITTTNTTLRPLGTARHTVFSRRFGDTGPSTSDSAKFAQDFLEAHNRYRSKHGVPSLSLSPQLCKYSDEWARHLANTGKLETHPKPQYGENLFCVMSSDPNYKVSAKEVVDAWYGEMKNHQFGKEPSQIQAGNFTQLVWKDSKELGVGVAKNAKGQTFVVANYNPPGNVIGKFEYQVPPVGGFPKGSPQEKSSSAGSSPSGKPQTDQEMRKQALSVHNELRARHGCPPLSLDEGLCKFAQEWANKLAKENRFEHRPNNKYGENIYQFQSTNESMAAAVPAKNAVESWYSEIKDFTFGKEPTSLKAGHFTQVIWKGTSKMGIAKARNGGRVVIVANYNPPGNFVGKFASNCPPPKKK